MISTQRIRYRDDITRYFLDTEFMDDGREFYAASAEADLTRANPWVRRHVLSHLPPRGDAAWRSRAQIRDDLTEFLQWGLKPELWAYFADYDWIVLCQLFGAMLDLPTFMPHLCLDLKQLSLLLGSPPHPVQTGTAHNALEDARWNKQLFEHLRSCP